MPSTKTHTTVLSPDSELGKISTEVLLTALAKRATRCTIILEDPPLEHLTISCVPIKTAQKPATSNHQTETLFPIPKNEVTNWLGRAHKLQYHPSEKSITLIYMLIPVKIIFHS